MPSSSTPREPAPEYLNCIERAEELGRLRTQAGMRKSLLVFGPESVGKSRLLQRFVESQPLALYAAQMRSPREFLLGLLHALHEADAKTLPPPNTVALSSSSLKGIVHRALDTRPYLMVLDHLDAPSRVLTGMVKDLHYYGRTPVIFASRSPHMEDIGALRPLCAGQSGTAGAEKPAPAVRLGVRATGGGKKPTAGLQSCNGSLLARRVERGKSRRDSAPAENGELPQYRAGDQIKAHILYVDYRMGRR